jgi:hypothetical protein
MTLLGYKYDYGSLCKPNDIGATNQIDCSTFASTSCSVLAKIIYPIVLPYQVLSGFLRKLGTLDVFYF